MAATSKDQPRHGFAGAAFSDDEEEAGAYAEQIAYSLSLSMVMQTAVELDLFEVIARANGSDGRISAADIADQLPAADKEEAADKVDRMLRLLAAFSLVTCSTDGAGHRVYGLAPAGRYFVRDDDGVSFGPLLSLAQDKVSLDTWGKLKDSIVEGGIPFNKAQGVSVYEYPKSDSRYNHVFNLAMVSHSAIVMKKVLHKYKGFENLKQLVDVGGGLGHTLKAIVSKYPSIKGINFDLPHVIEHAPPIPGVEHVGGDMLKSVPSPAEAILMKWLLPALGDDQCVEVLKNCHSALPSNGKVIVIEYVMEDEPETTSAAKAKRSRDVMLMTRHRGGRDRTRKEFVALANAAGFTTVEFECCTCNCWVMEFCK